MKYFFLLLCLFSLSTLAGTFNKFDTGYVEWSINAKDELTATVYRTGMLLELGNLSDKQHQMMTMIPSFSSLGKVSGFFKSSEKLSVEENVSYLSGQMEKFFNQELRDYPINYQVLSSHIEIHDLKCKTKGLLFKKTACTAQFKNSAEIELMD